ncbi:MAG TPA: imidazole glycerol phosphate synthase subunit HisH [Acidimicrobiales bacterium]|nr:imidazole glycerol phosphate synthase subunit HisH [Acidimicrobiales bacterium]
MIGIIDYKAGNARSVQYALTRLGIEAQLVTTPNEIEGVERIVLPGVGSARATMDFLHDSGCGAALVRRVLDEGAPFLGICVGLQVLFDHSEEGDVTCLGWLPGAVKRFPSGGLRVPQIGWNEVSVRTTDDRFAGYDEPRRHFYFVNSYYAAPADEVVLAATANYGEDFAAAVVSGNIMATQFHIEKSGPDGLELLRRWATC